ncbi:hypothetical protein [Sorangium sp. So ce117]|uniref:hypothetical protein n=1 Tax=Sorangium sp. So ce117 TaxID=3133277 RepID=UPI003F62061D
MTLDEHGFIRFRGFEGRGAVRSLVEEVDAMDRRLTGEGRAHINGVPLLFGARKDGSRYVVARATATGDARQRRVMYLPLTSRPLKDRRYRVYERSLGGNR